MNRVILIGLVEKVKPNISNSKIAISSLLVNYAYIDGNEYKYSNIDVVINDTATRNYIYIKPNTLVLIVGRLYKTKGRLFIIPDKIDSLKLYDELSEQDTRFVLTENGNMINAVLLSGDIKGNNIAINTDLPIKGIVNKDKNIPVKWINDVPGKIKGLLGYLGNNKVYS